MVARRVIAVSPDETFGQQLATALTAAGGEVEVHQTLESLGSGLVRAALCVIHLDGGLADGTSELLRRVTAPCPVIVVLPHSDLVAVVALMRSSERVVGMLVAEDFDPRRLTAMGTRILTDDMFGLDKIMVSGKEIHTLVIGNYQEKSQCMSLISEMVEQIGVPRKYRPPIEQCIDEMLMNALYDAPVDADGRHIFSGVPTRTRITLRSEQSVVVQVAYDGEQFAVAVRDAFGSLARDTALQFLHKSLHAEQQVDRKAGGAGLGLYLMASASTSVFYNVLPGIATEAICTFDLGRPKLQLEQFGFFVQSDAAGQVATGPSRVLPATPIRGGRLFRWGVAGLAVTAAIALVGGLLWPHIFGGAKRPEAAQLVFTTVPKGVTIKVAGRLVQAARDGTLSVGDLEIGRAYPVVAHLDGFESKEVIVRPHPGANALTFELHPIATVELDSQPTGATVDVDGKPMGTTPLTLTSLVPGATVSIVFNRAGYRAATAQLQVPAAGTLKGLVQPLALSEEMVGVRFVSNPAGARIIDDSQVATADRTYTPAEVFVHANTVQHFTLSMPKRVPVVIAAFTPSRGAHGLEKGGDLVEGVTLRIEATLDGKATISGAPQCQDVALPIDCTLAPGTYVVDYLGPDGAKISHTVSVAKDAIETFELGYIEAGAGKLLQPGGARTAVFEVGEHTVTVSDATGTHTATVRVKPRAVVIAN